MEKKYTAFRYIAYSLEILLIYVIGGSGLVLPELFGGRPMLLISAALTIAFFENELPSMFFGIASGALIDIGTDGNIGFFTFALGFSCFVIGNIFRDYMVVSFLNSLAFCGGFILGLIVLKFIIKYGINGFNNSGYYFLHHYVARIVYTFVLSPLLYWLNKGLYRNLRDA